MLNNKPLILVTQLFLWRFLDVSVTTSELQDSIQKIQIRLRVLLVQDVNVRVKAIHGDETVLPLLDQTSKQLAANNQNITIHSTRHLQLKHTR